MKALLRALRNQGVELLQQSKMTTALRKIPGPDLVIFNFHRIRGTHPTVFDETLFGTDSHQFRRQMEWLKKTVRILSEPELLEIIKLRKPLRERCAMVTFDDGYRDNYDLAYPILRELGIPATFFIPTGMVDSRRLGWWDIANYLIKSSPRTQLDFRGQRIDLTGERGLVARKIVGQLREIQAAEIDGFLADLSKACACPFPSLALQDAELMNWEQVQEVARNGITIGSHTHHHSMLSKMDLAAQERELIQSKVFLEQKLGSEIHSLAYPVGNYDAFNLETKDLAAGAGYSIAFSFLTGSNSWERMDRFDIRRIDPPYEVARMDLVFSLPKMAYRPRGARRAPLSYESPSPKFE
jgi:peptidoglycan/xylan/chitin deacetylase (PgdA/CDA1 family)